MADEKAAKPAKAGKDEGNALDPKVMAAKAKGEAKAKKAAAAKETAETVVRKPVPDYSHAVLARGRCAEPGQA